MTFPNGKFPAREYALLTIEQDIHWLRDVSPDQMRRIMDALYRVHRFFGVMTDLNNLLESIMEEGKVIANAEACSLLLFDDARQELYFHITKGETGDQQALKREVRLRLGQGIAGAAAATRASINVEDVRQDGRFYSDADEITHFTTRSLLAVPMLDRERLVGVIELVNKEGGEAFARADLHVMEIFASLAAAAITNARLIEENMRAVRMAAIGEAVAGLSHHLKNIVTGMMGATDLIDQGLENKNAEVIGTCWPIFKRSANRISDFVQDMLAFSKPRVPVRAWSSVPHLLQALQETISGAAPRKRVEVAVDLDDGIDVAYIDSPGIFRGLLNLVQNAADAVPADGGKVEIRARRTDGALVLEVADNGPGVPEEIRYRIFDPFFSTKGSSGTGLGLAVAYKIVKEHGGDIAVEPHGESGALFRVTLPQACRER